MATKREHMSNWILAGAAPLGFLVTPPYDFGFATLGVAAVLYFTWVGLFYLMDAWVRKKVHGPH